MSHDEKIGLARRLTDIVGGSVTYLCDNVIGQVFRERTVPTVEPRHPAREIGEGLDHGAADMARAKQDNMEVVGPKGLEQQCDVTAAALAQRRA